MSRCVDKKIRVSFEEVTAERYYTGIVKPHSNTAGRIYLPRSMVGKMVFIIVKEEKKHEEIKD